MRTCLFKVFTPPTHIDTGQLFIDTSVVVSQFICNSLDIDIDDVYWLLDWYLG